MSERSRRELMLLQSLPLTIKIQKTILRLQEWIDYYGEDGVYLSWSGGKDSTVLRHIIRQYWPNVVSVFANTGLEFPEVQAFVRSAKERGEPVEIVYPVKKFYDVIKERGYPVISKDVAECVRKARNNIQNGDFSTQRVRNLTGQETGKFDFSKYEPLLYVDFLISEQCCDDTKKSPFAEYEKRTGRVPIIAMLAEESRKRENGWMKTGCNAFERKHPQSNPMAFWTNQDVLEYIHLYNVEIPSVYGRVEWEKDPEQVRMCEIIPDLPRNGYDTLKCTGCQRTGCIYCGFGAHLSRRKGDFKDLKRTHPKQYAYCIGGGEYGEDGIWRPNKEGLGMGHVFDVLNELYGPDFIEYKQRRQNEVKNHHHGGAAHGTADGLCSGGRSDAAERVDEH